MTAALMPHPGNMPSYNNTVDLDEVSSLPSDFSFPQSSMASTAPGMFSFSQTEPSTDLLSGSSWGTTEGPQNLSEFPDNGSSPTGDAEEYIFTSGQTTPRGSRLDQSQTTGSSWHAPKAPLVASGAQAMSRVSSSRSIGSSMSQASHMSNMSARGNASFHNGPQTTGSLAGLDSCLLLDADANTVTSQMYWPDYTLDMGLNTDGVGYQVPDVNPLHVVPAQMHLGQDGLPETSSPSTWDCFSSSISRTSSPATIDDSWTMAPLSPDSSPDLSGQSPSAKMEVPVMPEEMHRDGISQLDDALTLPPPFAPRRQGSEGESARDHALYKNASPQADGLFHCPWEGQAGCNHKAEKLKCNYDKFVDSHLKPYRCKAEACEGARFSSTACLLRHEREAHGLHGHGDKPFLCMYEGCERSVLGSGFPRQWNLRDHMKRVHNDHGSTGGSPPSATAQPAAKGRKRKTDVPEQSSAPSRKASIKSMPAVEPKQPASKPLIEQWLDHRKAVEDILHGLEKPEDARNLQHITEVQKRLSAMAKMTSDLAATKVEMMSSTGRKNFVSGG